MTIGPWAIIKKAVIPSIARVIVDGVEKKHDRTLANPAGLGGFMNILSGGKRKRRRKRGYKRRNVRVRKHK